MRFPLKIRMGEGRLAIKSKSQGEKNRALKSVRYGYFWTNSCGDQTFFPEVTLPKPNPFFIEESVAFDVMESFRSDPKKIYGVIKLYRRQSRCFRKKQAPPKQGKIPWKKPVRQVYISSMISDNFFFTASSLKTGLDNATSGWDSTEEVFSPVFFSWKSEAVILSALSKPFPPPPTSISYTRDGKKLSFLCKETEERDSNKIDTGTEILSPDEKENARANSIW